MLNSWFVLSIGISVAAWIGVTLFERRQHKRKLENLRRRIRKSEAANSQSGSDE